MKRLAVSLFGLMLVLAACGGSKGAAEHNAADVDFVSGMIPHHEQAVVMSKLAATNATDPKIKDIASRIQAGQDPEIQEMKGFLTSWGEKAKPSGDEGGHGGGHRGGAPAAHPGMMTPEQMKSLESARGPAFDKLFAEQMIEHHEGAVLMAKVELDKGKAAEAKALATKIIAAQEGELTELKAFLSSAG